MKSNFKFLLFSAFLILLTSGDLEAQRKNRLIQKADKLFQSELYFDANELYKKGYKKTKNKAIKAEVLFKQAECYRYTSKYKQASNFYKKSIKAKYNNSNPIAIYHYADMLMRLGNYEKALEQFKKYSKKVPNDNKVKRKILSCEYSVNWINNPTRYDISKKEDLYNKTQIKINSSSNDYSPTWGNREYTKIYFVSSREGSSNNKTDGTTGESFTDIYFTELNKKGNWIKPVPLEQPINSESSEGPLCLNQNGTTMFFTSCQSDDKKPQGCGISISQIQGKNWGPLNKLEIKLDSNTVIGHPTISPDEQFVIFSSDMPGGQGGHDLWIVTRVARGQWSEPANLGPEVNTDGNEVFPYLHNDGSLYFSSNGHIGMGGLDIYKTELNDFGKYDNVINLKYPINSSADDFGYITRKDTETGFFSSNRKNWIDAADGEVKKSNGFDNIFSFFMRPLVLTIQGVVTDSKSKSIVVGANVKLVGDDGTAFEVTTDNTGSYNFDLNPVTTYEIIVTRDGYLDHKFSETTVGIEDNTDLIADISLNPIFKDIRLPRIYYDFAKWDLRDTSKLDLDRVYQIMIDNPEVVIELNSHTDYRGDDKANLELSQKRANECINYLISRGISSDRMIANGKGESSPYIITKEDVENYRGKGLFKKKIFKLGQILTEDFINNLKRADHKEVAHQLNRRTTFNVISQSYDPEFEKLFRNSISNLPEINQIKSQNNIADFIWNVENATDFPLTVYYNGIINGNKIILPNQTESILLVPGRYRIVAGNFDGSTQATPYSGTRVLEGGNKANTTFIITNSKD